MLYFGQISVWGILLTMALFALAIALLWLLDRRLVLKALRLRIRIPRVPQRLLLFLFGAMLLSAAALAGALALALPGRVFWPLFLLLLFCLFGVTPRAFEVYLRCLKHTEAHRRYLIANGATHLESIVPSARRALRAAMLPMLWQRSSHMPLNMSLMFCVLLLSGSTIAAALVITLMTWAAAITASVLSTVLALWLNDRKLFTKEGNANVKKTA